MIDIEREGTEIVFTATAEYPITGTRFAAKWNAGTEWAARLLWHHLAHRMGERLQQIRRQAYEQGWKDAKAHRTKQNWFDSTWQ